MITTKSCRYYLAALLLLLSPFTWASCSVAAPGSSSATLTGSFTVSRDNPAGGRLGGTYGSYYGTPTALTCTSPTAYFFLKFATPMAASASVSNAYETNVPGIGVRVWVESYTKTTYVSNDGMFWGTSSSGSATLNDSVAITGLQLQFYQTGKVATGTVTLPALTIEAWVNDSNSMMGAVKLGQFTLNVSIPVTVNACTTPDVSVALNKHKITEFSGIGSTSSSTSFNLQLINCPANLSVLSYGFEPVTSLLNSPAQYITLDGSSVASGVGIQLLDNRNTLIPFNTMIWFANGFEVAGGSYTVTLKARYIQTAATIQPGSANSAVVFTISYR